MGYKARCIAAYRTLTVIDSKGVNSFQTLEITVNNVAPVLDAGADQVGDDMMSGSTPIIKCS
jgi:hypothetical protein